jgi:hypothetical protein
VAQRGDRLPFHVGTDGDPDPGGNVPDSSVPFAGVGGWVYQLFHHFGSVENMIAQALAAGCASVYIKSNDDGNHSGFRADQAKAGVVQACHDAGLKCYFWGYVYDEPASPDAFVYAAGELIEMTGADGYIVDFEQEAENADHAVRVANLLRERLPDTPLAVAPQAIIHLHEKMRIDVWADLGYVLMPQSYAEALGGDRPGSFGDLDAIFAEWWNRAPNAVIMPIMQTYDDPPIASQSHFLALCKERGVAGYSLYRLDTMNLFKYQHAMEAI